MIGGMSSLVEIGQVYCIKTGNSISWKYAFHFFFRFSLRLQCLTKYNLMHKRSLKYD